MEENGGYFPQSHVDDVEQKVTRILTSSGGIHSLLENSSLLSCGGTILIGPLAFFLLWLAFGSQFWAAGLWAIGIVLCLFAISFIAHTVSKWAANMTAKHSLGLSQMERGNEALRRGL